MTKKILALLLSVLFCVLCFSTASATDYSFDSAINRDEILEPQAVPEVTLSVTPVHQQTSYYCSAACAYMVLKYFGITSYSQSTLYNYFTNNGTIGVSSAKIVEFLSNKISSKTFSKYKDISQSVFNSKIKTCLNNGCPVIMSGRNFPYYNYTSGHFIVIYGYRIGSNPTRNDSDPNSLDNTLYFKIIDPWEPNGTWTQSGSRKILTTNQLYSAYNSYSNGTGNIIVGS